MRIKKVENLIGIALEVSAKDFEKVQKYAPEATKLVDEEGNEKFAVAGTAGKFCGSVLGELNNVGAMFQFVGDKPLIWMGIDTEYLDNAKQHLMDDFGVSLANLRLVEKQIKNAVEAVDAKIASVGDAFSETDI